MANKVWKGSLVFGIVTIPVYLNVAARGESISLNMIHTKCNGRVKMPRYCPTCEEQIPNEEIVKGYDTGNGFVLITPEEIEAIAPRSAKSIEISECVKWSDVDPVYLAESFYLLPEEAGAKSYSLLVQALRKTGRVGIAQLCKSNREHVVLIRPRGNGLMAHFLYYPAEIPGNATFESLPAAAPDGKLLKLAVELVDRLATDFLPEQYENGYTMRLNQLIASKLDKTVQAPEPVKETKAPKMDLAAALEASLQRPRRKIELEGKSKAKSKKQTRKAA